MPVRIGLLLIILLGGCLRTDIPRLVQDSADIFSAEAEAAAEERLQAVARETGRWGFVITEEGGDPPRMLDEPMRVADARNVSAMAVLLDGTQVLGIGSSRRSVAQRDQLVSEDSRVHEFLAAGNADAALEVMVRDFEVWSTAPPRPS